MKKVKFLLPVVAIVFAVAGVFATGNPTTALVPVDVTLGEFAISPDGPNCIRDGVCSNVAGTTCKTISLVILKVRAGEESCSVNAVGTYTPD